MWFFASTVAALTVMAPIFAVHNRLDKSLPAAGQTVGSPKEIRLWFTEKVQPALSRITLTTADSGNVAIGNPRATDDPKSIAVDVAGPLSPGKYTVSWRTAGDDGHAVRGRFSFSVAP